MPHSSITRLTHLCNIIPGLILNLPAEEFEFKPNPEKWSKKEILGHLIDSATNNHQRFIRVQFEDMPHIVYDQNNWNKFSFYQDMERANLVSLWTIYNRHLCEIIKRIPTENLNRKCKTENEVTLSWLIDDYVVHLEHHLKQIVSYQ